MSVLNSANNHYHVATLKLHLKTEKNHSIKKLFNLYRVYFIRIFQHLSSYCGAASNFIVFQYIK